MLDALREEVCEANRAIVRHGLVTLTFGNVSAFDAESGLVAIKPSGVDYDTLSPDQIVIVDLDEKVVEGDLRPSSDMATHVALYRAFEGLGGVAHTHSMYATIFAQARKEIPCMGTTHADHFYGAVPVTRELRADEVNHDYEARTGAVIVERFGDLNAQQMPAVLVARHGPFTWGPTAMKAVEEAVALEAVARMALGTLTLDPDLGAIPPHLLDRHFLRKHGPGAYYGQNGQ